MKKSSHSKLADIIIFLLTPFALLISGCESKEPVIGKSEISQVFAVNSSPTFQGYYYRGSDEQYHYFTSQWKYGADRKFKIQLTDLNIEKTFPTGEKNLRIYLFDQPEKELEFFTEFDGRKIYMEK